MRKLGYVFEGAGAPAYFTEADKNPGGLDHVDEGDQAGRRLGYPRMGGSARPR